MLGTSIRTDSDPVTNKSCGDHLRVDVEFDSDLGDSPRPLIAAPQPVAIVEQCRTFRSGDQTFRVQFQSVDGERPPNGRCVHTNFGGDRCDARGAVTVGKPATVSKKRMADAGTCSITTTPAGDVVTSERSQHRRRRHPEQVSDLLD